MIRLSKEYYNRILSKYYRFESADTLCEQFYKFVNTLRKEKKEEMQEKYPWLEVDNERKHVR